MEKHVDLTSVGHASSRIACKCMLEPMPFLSPCYCDECGDPLTESRLLDSHYGWCPRCKGIVPTSLFQVPSWAMGGVVFLIAARLL